MLWICWLAGILVGADPSPLLLQSLDRMEGIAPPCNHPLSTSDDITDLNKAITDLNTLITCDFEADAIMAPAWKTVLDPLQEEARYLKWRYSEQQRVINHNLHSRLYVWVEQVKNLSEKLTTYKHWREQLKKQSSRGSVFGGYLLVQELAGACGLLPWRRLLEFGQMQPHDKQNHLVLAVTDYFHRAYSAGTRRLAEYEVDVEVSITNAAYGLMIILQHAMQKRTNLLDETTFVRCFELWQECKAIHLAGLLHSFDMLIPTYGYRVNDRTLTLSKEGRWVRLHGQPQAYQSYYQGQLAVTKRYSYETTGLTDREEEGDTHAPDSFMARLPEAPMAAHGLPIIWQVYRRLMTPMTWEISHLGLLYLFDQGVKLTVDLAPESPWAKEIATAQASLI